MLWNSEPYATSITWSSSGHMVTHFICIHCEAELKTIIIVGLMLLFCP